MAHGYCVTIVVCRDAGGSNIWNCKTATSCYSLGMHVVYAILHVVLHAFSTMTTCLLLFQVFAELRTAAEGYSAVLTLNGCTAVEASEDL